MVGDIMDVLGDILDVLGDPFLSSPAGYSSVKQWQVAGQPVLVQPGSMLINFCRFTSAKSMPCN